MVHFTPASYAQFYLAQVAHINTALVAHFDRILHLTIIKNTGGIDTYRILKLKKKEMWLEELGQEEIHLSLY